MSEFHYVRTLGVDGGVDACEGPAIGLDLETVLADGLPPWNIALELVAAMCEILDISTEDNKVHGDLHPKYVFIDETGAVSIEGFGIPRHKTSSPEGVPKGPPTDLYGLGLLAFACVSAQPLPIERIPKDDPDAHDDAIIDHVLSLDLSGLPDSMQGDIQWFLAKLVAFDREDRPSAVEAWRTFIAFASEVDGPDVAEWCAAALDGGGERRTPVARPVAGAKADEELGGPVMAKLAMEHDVAFDGGGSAKGGATAFWTKEDMKRALERDHAADDEGPPQGVGGGSATNFWSRDQLAAMAQGEAEAPRPKRAKGEGERRKATSATRASAVRAERANETSPPVGGPQVAPFTPVDDDRPTDPSVALAPQAPRSGVSARPPAPPPPPPQRPSRDDSLSTAPVPTLDPDPSEGIPAPAPAPTPRAVAAPPTAKSMNPPPSPSPRPAPAATVPSSDAPEGGGGVRLALLGGSGCAVGAVALLVVAVIGLVVVAIALNSRDPGAVEPSPELPQPAMPAPVDDTPPPPEDAAPVDPKPAPKPGSKPDPKPNDPKPSPKPADPKPAPKPSDPKPAPKPTDPKPAPKPEPKPVEPKPATPKPEPKPKPQAPATGDAKVTLRSSGRGKVLVCLDAAKSFDGPTSFVIEQWKLPANCLVQIDGAKGILSVNGSGTTTCDKQGDAVVCSPSSL